MCSAVSTISIVGTSSEVYLFGTQIVIAGFGGLLSILITWTLVLPVFCGPLDIKTPYEVSLYTQYLTSSATQDTSYLFEYSLCFKYFELRYDRKVRIVSSTIYILHTILYLPVILFSCTLPLSVATGIALPICTTVIGGICLFYTMLVRMEYKNRICT